MWSQIKNEIKTNLSVSVPLILSQLIYASSSFIGTAMVAQLGEDALAASVLVSTIWMSAAVFFFGLLNAVSVLISHQYGAKDEVAISKTMGQSFIFGAILLVLMLVIFIFVPYILQFSAQPESVLSLAKEYLHALLWTIPALILLIIYEQFLAGIHLAKIVLRISLVVVPIEIPLIYLLIFGKMGLPKCGIAGIGYGFAITYTLTAIGMTIYLLRSSYYKPFGIFKQISKIDVPRLLELTRLGLPLGFMHLIEMSTFAVGAFWIGQFSTTWLAAHQIVIQYLGFLITIAFAMSQGLTVRVGYLIGSAELHAVPLSIIVGIALSGVSSLLVAFLFLMMPHLLIGLDIDLTDPGQAALIAATVFLLKLAAIQMFFDNFRILGFGALRGLKDSRFPMIASFVAFWVIGLVSAYLFAFTFDYRSAGVWYGVTLGIGSGAVIVLLRVWQQVRLQMRQMSVR